MIAIMVALNLIPTDNQWIYYDDINGVATAIQVGEHALLITMALPRLYVSLSHLSKISHMILNS